MKRAATICGAGICAAASFAAVWALLVAFSGCSSIQPIAIGPRIPPQPPGLPRHRMILSAVGDDMIAVVHGCEGAEAVALYRVEPSKGLSLLAARNIHWDLMAYDYNSNGKGIRVATAQAAIEGAMKQRSEKYRGLMDENWKRLAEQENRARALNEEEAQRLRDREANPPPLPEPK
ncbi:MAG: hypothetical protein K8T20_10240 [Planctomycetes bacterium]|nr:hypothetical protein [Planctomycetota bacterium]